MDYAVKIGVTAASECLCYRIYSACGIAVPYHSILTMADGSFAFGSRIERGITNFALSTPNEKNSWLADCAAIISAICALDLLIANEDRHAGNFLFMTGINNRKSCMAMDFSRALLYAPWPLPPTWSVANNTTTMINVLRQTGLWHVTSAAQALLSAATIQHQTWKTWVEALPAGWLNDGFQDTLIAWWNSPEFHQRLQDCMSAVK
ncbi:MAG: hypothetical protein ACYCSZ_02425 [Burkholderiales bacterium]